MTAIATRSSVLGVKPESTEGTLVAPAAATDYVPLQTDFSMEPNLEQIENLELSGTIGRKETILGAENPTATFSVYMKAYGTQGTAPQWSDIFKAFFGTETTEATERSLTSSSTTSLLKMTGASGFVARGYGLLLKDSVNGYRVRVVHSVATTDITPSFNVPSAPASGVQTGKPVYWTPANSSHQALSLWWYGGNGGVIQAMSGSRPISLAIDATAGQPITCNVSFEGIGWYVNPVEVTAATSYIDFTDDDGTFAAVLPVRWYKDPDELADAAAEVMNNASPGETHTCSYSHTAGTFTFTASGALFTIKWNTGANTANTAATKFGFTAAADSSAALTYTGSASTFGAPHTPTFDTTQPLVAKNQEVMVGSQSDYTCFNASNVTINGTCARRIIESICAETGRSGSIYSSREWEITITALLDKYDVDKFARFREGTETRFQYTMGKKTGGNWDEGSIVYAYGPTCKVTSVAITDDDGLVTLEMTLQPFVNSTGEAEFIMGTL